MTNPQCSWWSATNDEGVRSHFYIATLKEWAIDKILYQKGVICIISKVQSMYNKDDWHVEFKADDTFNFPKAFHLVNMEIE